MCAPGPPAFRGVRILGTVLKDLAEDRLPVPHGMPPEWWSQVANKFIPTLFAGVLDGAVMLRVLDAFFCGGGLRTLVAASLRLVECYFAHGIDEVARTQDPGTNSDGPPAAAGLEEEPGGARVRDGLARCSTDPVGAVPL